MSQTKLYCAFFNRLEAAFSVNCTPDHDTYEDLKEKIQQRTGLDAIGIHRWVLYRPGRVLDKGQPFIPNQIDSRLPSKFLLKSISPTSSDPEIDIVVVVTNEPASLKRSIDQISGDDQSASGKRSIREFSASGTVL